MKHRQNAEISAAFGARLVEVEFSGVGDFGNNPIKVCTYDWIHSTDADQLCSDAVAAEVRSTMAEQDLAYAYYVPRVNYFIGTWVRQSGWQLNCRQLQLFENGMMTYDLKVVYERFVLQPGGRIAHLRNCICQIPFESIVEMRNKENGYSTLGGEGVSNIKASMWQALLHGVGFFIKHYIFKSGFLDRWAGFAIALGNFDGTFYRYVKATEQHNDFLHGNSGCRSPQTDISS